VHLRQCAALKNAHFGPYEYGHIQGFLHISFVSIT
jgi:hypothetical protein